MNAFQICKIMQDEGVFINPVVPPAVQPGQCLIRFSVMSTHTLEQLSFALDKIAKISKQFHLESAAEYHAGAHEAGAADLSKVSVGGAGL